MQWYSPSERSTGSDRGTPSTGVSTEIGADNQPNPATFLNQLEKLEAAKAA